jgi:hypothetical protein
VRHNLARSELLMFSIDMHKSKKKPEVQKTLGDVRAGIVLRKKGGAVEFSSFFSLRGWKGESMGTGNHGRKTDRTFVQKLLGICQ